MSRATLTMLVHGEAGVGKSWLGASTPGPRLILDAEGRAKYLPTAVATVYWDPAQSAPPAYDGSWDTCIAVVPDFKTMDLVYRWLQSGQHPFISVVVDSLMEIQKRLIDETVGLNQVAQQDWGIILRKLEKLVRDYRDLVLVDANPVDVVLMTVGSKEGNGGKMRPMLQGAMGTTVPYFMDIVGYLYTTHDLETGTIGRSMLIQPTNVAVAKDGTDKLTHLGASIPNPSVHQIFELLKQIEQQSAPPAAPPVESAPESNPAAPQA